MPHGKLGRNVCSTTSEYSDIRHDAEDQECVASPVRRHSLSQGRSQCSCDSLQCDDKSFGLCVLFWAILNITKLLGGGIIWVRGKNREGQGLL